MNTYLWAIRLDEYATKFAEAVKAKNRYKVRFWKKKIEWAEEQLAKEALKQ